MELLSARRFAWAAIVVAVAACDGVGGPATSLSTTTSTVVGPSPTYDPERCVITAEPIPGSSHARRTVVDRTTHEQIAHDPGTGTFEPPGWEARCQ